MEDYEDPEPKGKLILKVGRLVILMIQLIFLSLNVMYIYVNLLIFNRRAKRQGKMTQKILLRVPQISMKKLCSYLKICLQQL